MRGRCRVLPISIGLASRTAVPKEVRGRVRSALGYTDKDAVFLFLGRLVYYKGVQELILAAAQAGVKLLIGGEGPLEAALRKQVNTLGVSRLVTFLGRVPEVNLPGIFAASDVFVLPSNAASEAFGVVQLEAMAHGLPVINTNLPTGVPEVSRHGETGLTVSPGNVHELAGALRKLATDVDLRQHYGEAALRRVTEFSTPKIKETLRQIYREVHAQPIRALAAVQAPPAQLSPSGVGL